MNIGQVMELHLGMAARTLGIHIATPVFDGASSEDLWSTVKEAGMDSDAKQSFTMDVLGNRLITVFLLELCT